MNTQEDMDKKSRFPIRKFDSLEAMKDKDRRAGKQSASRLFTLIPYGAGQIASTSATG